uniref:Uncharacterized protein n=1 Tax=Anguilla anguilla TaxID=7936 RepID=A0A0E9VHD7_ANGAN
MNRQITTLVSESYIAIVQGFYCSCHPKEKQLPERPDEQNQKQNRYSQTKGMCSTFEPLPQTPSTALRTASCCWCCRCPAAHR